MWRPLLLLLALSAAAYAQGHRVKETEEQKRSQKVRDLNRELRELPSRSPSGIARASDQRRIFAEIAKINHPDAIRAIVNAVDETEYAPLREELLRMLADAPSADEAIVSRVMRQHIAPDDPARRIARDYLLTQAVRRHKDEFPHTLFYLAPSLEDRFLSLHVMGKIGSIHTLECASTLVKDKSWLPDESGLVSCGTIAMALEDEEGPAAARLLLLLTKDPRFTTADTPKLRQATRTWHQTDLRTYVNLADLTDRDPLNRRDTATFLGAVGLEAARAPLVRMAYNRGEAAEVRAAAATALGGLSIAREDLVEQLGKLLSEADPVVRTGAVEGLLRLNVVQAAEALVSMLDGPYAEEARAALSRRTGQPLETDWRKWLKKAFPAGPGTAPPSKEDGK